MAAGGCTQNSSVCALDLTSIGSFRDESTADVCNRTQDLANLIHDSITTIDEESCTNSGAIGGGETLGPHVPDLQARSMYQQKQCLAPQEKLKKLGKKMWNRFEKHVKKRYGKNNNCKYSSFGTLDEYVKTDAYDVPPLLYFCILEIESRGFLPGGIYRIGVSQEPVIEIIKHFLKRGPNTQLLMKFSSHILANCIVHFLSNLEEPLIPPCMREDFLNISRSLQASYDEQCSGFEAYEEKVSVEREIFEMKKQYYKELVMQLPPASRDTLRMLCSHLLNISLNHRSGMSVMDLAEVFGPILFGFPQEVASYEDRVAIVDATSSMIQIDRACFHRRITEL